MAVSEKMKLKAKAATLGIEGYRRMEEADLKTAIAAAEGTKSAAPTKGAAVVKGTGNGAKSKPAATGVVKGAVKGAAKPAAKGAAKVSTAPAKGKVVAKASTPSPATKSKSQKTAPAKGQAAKGTAKRAGAKVKTAAKGAVAKVAASVKRAPLDVGSINWDAETNVGQTPGKRQDVLRSLRKHAARLAGLKTKTLDAETLYTAVFEELRANAPGWYPNAQRQYPHLTKVGAAEKMLRWLIARVAYDFAYKSGQHAQGHRTWTKPTHPEKGANRPKPATAAKGRATAAKGKAAPARKPTAKPATKPPVRKPAAAAKKAPARKPAAAKKPAVRKTTARRPSALAVKG